MNDASKNDMLIEYSESLKDMSIDQLNAEREKLHKKMTTKVLHLGTYSYTEKEVDISNNSEFKNRLYVRHKLKLLVKMINIELKNRKLNYQEYWKKISDFFRTKTSAPSYAYMELDKSATFADRLSLDGIILYKKYLLFLYDAMSNEGKKVVESMNQAFDKVADVDRNMLYYGDIFSKDVVIGTDKVVNAILKETVLNKKLKDMAPEL